MRCCGHCCSSGTPSAHAATSPCGSAAQMLRCACMHASGELSMHSMHVLGLVHESCAGHSSTQRSEGYVAVSALSCDDAPTLAHAAAWLDGLATSPPRQPPTGCLLSHHRCSTDGAAASIGGVATLMGAPCCLLCPPSKAKCLTPRALANTSCRSNTAALRFSCCLRRYGVQQVHRGMRGAWAGQTLAGQDC